MGEIRFPNLGLEFSVGKSFSIFGFDIAFYGIIIALGLIAGALVAYHDARRRGQNVDLYMDYTLFGMLGAIVGARLYYVAFEWDYYSKHLDQIINLRAGGLAIYGAIIGATLVLLVFCKIKKENPLKMLDTIVLGIVVGQIIGRWGNFFNREAYGGFTDSLFAMQIPVKDATVVNTDMIVSVDGAFYVQVHPTFLYESFLNSILLVLLLVFRDKKKFNGETLCRYLVGYGIIRFFIEGMRTDQLLLKGVAVSQVLSAVLAVAALAVIVVMRIRLRGKSLKTEEVVLEATTGVSDDAVESSEEIVAEDAEVSDETVIEDATEE